MLRSFPKLQSAKRQSDHTPWQLMKPLPDALHTCGPSAFTHSRVFPLSGSSQLRLLAFTFFAWTTPVRSSGPFGADRLNVINAICHLVLQFFIRLLENFQSVRLIAQYPCGLFRHSARIKIASASSSFATSSSHTKQNPPARPTGSKPEAPKQDTNLLIPADTKPDPC